MTTTSRVGRNCRIVLLLTFVTLTLGINFLHSDAGPGAGRECPACRFLSSSLSTSPGPIIVVPALLCRGTLALAESPAFGEAVVLDRSSRSPPQA